jgi:hypothetical protein
MFFNRTEDMITYFALPPARILEDNMAGEFAPVDSPTSKKIKAEEIKNFIGRYNQVIDYVNSKLVYLNQLIKAYNQIKQYNEDDSIDPEKAVNKKLILKEIFLWRQDMLRSCDDVFINQSAVFQSKIQRSLLNDIQAQAKKLDISSLSQLERIGQINPLANASVQEPSLPWLITNMSQQKVEQFFLIFFNMKNYNFKLAMNSLVRLYGDKEEGYSSFQRFLSILEGLTLYENSGSKVDVCF